MRCKMVLRYTLYDMTSHACRCLLTAAGELYDDVGVLVRLGPCIDPWRDKPVTTPTPGRVECPLSEAHTTIYFCVK